MIPTATTTNASVPGGHPEDGFEDNMRVEGLWVDRWVGSQNSERNLTIGAHSPKGKATALNDLICRNPAVDIDIRMSG